MAVEEPSGPGTGGGAGPPRARTRPPGERSAPGSGPLLLGGRLGGRRGYVAGPRPGRLAAVPE